MISSWGRVWKYFAIRFMQASVGSIRGSGYGRERGLPTRREAVWRGRFPFVSLYGLFERGGNVLLASF